MSEKYNLNGIPDVTICIPVFNAEDTIYKAVDSAVNQSYVNYKIVISNNCSTDNTLEIIKASFKEQISNGKVSLYEREKNYGEINNFKYVIEQAKSDYILILGADDYISNNCLKILMPTVRDNNVDVACGIVEVFTENKRYAVEVPAYNGRQDFIKKTCSRRKLNYLFCGIWDREKFLNTMSHMDYRLAINGTASDRLFVMVSSWFYDMKYATAAKVVYYKNSGRTNRIINNRFKAALYSIKLVLKIPAAIDSYKISWYLYIFPMWLLFVIKSLTLYRLSPLETRVLGFLKRVVGDDNYLSLKSYLKK